MKRENSIISIIIVSVILSIPVLTPAQFSQAARDSIQKYSKKDHKLMLEKLDIEELRPGPSGNPQDSNYCNTDESKASPYDSLPDPLTFDNGESVKTKQDWKERKSEIKAHFSKEVYGRLPSNIPSVSWEVISEKDTSLGEYQATVKEVRGRVDNSHYPKIDVDIEMRLTLPADINNAIPLILEFGFHIPEQWKNRGNDGPSKRERLLKKGWGYAKLYANSIQPDNGAGLRKGIIGLVNKGEPRARYDWGALRAWAWGASRALDYFEKKSIIDKHRVGIAGLSRYGKAALVTMAYDSRFDIGLIGSSGAGGAKILRRKFGEQVENLASSAEYHWFAPNFIKYAGPKTPNDLPVDAHELIALCAPRPVFISTGDPKVEGPWVDAKGMFLGAVHASPVYELLGSEGLEKTVYPDKKIALTKGDLAFAQHSKGHVIGPNWPVFIKFATRYFEE